MVALLRNAPQTPLDTLRALLSEYTPEDGAFQGHLQHLLQAHRRQVFRELGARLAAFAAQNPDVPVFVAAPGTVEYQKVMDTMALVQAAGVPKVSLMSQPGGNAR